MDTLGHDQPQTSSDIGLSPALLGLILLPLGVPLLWLIAPLLTAVTPVFSFTLPAAIAVSLIGLGLGVGFTRGWSHTSRVWIVVMLVFSGYLTAGALHFMKKEWVEELKRHIGPGDPEWRKFEPADKAYTVQVAGRKQELAKSPLTGWAVSGFRFSPEKKGARELFDVAFDVAVGTPPEKLIGARLADEAWFETARAAMETECGVEASNTRDLIQQRMSGREFVFTLPDGVTNRVVRIYRDHKQFYYLAVEGPFVREDAPYVKKFFSHFRANIAE